MKTSKIETSKTNACGEQYDMVLTALADIANSLRELADVTKAQFEYNKTMIEEQQRARKEQEELIRKAQMTGSLNVVSPQMINFQNRPH